jgi:uncharacterized membrane protein
MEIFLILVLFVFVIIFHFRQGAKFQKLHRHIDALQKQLNDSSRKVAQHAEKESPQTQTTVIPEKKILPPVIRSEEKPVAEKKEIPPVKEKAVEEERVKIPVIEHPRVIPPVKVAEPQLSWWDKFKEKNPDLEKFIGENLLSKIAITILVLGIAFFVKYAIDQDWINEAARVGIGILCGTIVMLFAHRLHVKFKAFSSVLVAGAIAIFYFTIAIGFHEYHLFSQTLAFVMMLAITAFSVFISVAYNRVELAALAITGGFAVPFMLSTGQGNYKVLFSYILILDVGMLALAYLKKWNLINILAYAFTVILYSVWLGTRVLGESLAPYKGAFIFGLIFYVVFVLMNVINNIKEKRQFTYIELIILISNTFIFYISGMLVLKEWQPELKGIYTIAMGIFNFVLAVALYRYFKADKKLVYLLIGLTLTFATLAAPVQLKGNYITLFWGAEAALLIWLSLHSQIKAFKLASVIVSLLMFFSLMMDYATVYGYNHGDVVQPLLNKGFVTGMCSAIFLFTGALFLRKDETTGGMGFHINSRTYSKILTIAAIFITYLSGFFEVHHQSAYYIYSTNSVVGISCFYHLVFTSLLGIILLKRYSVANNIISFVLLAFNLIYYSFIFAIAPYHELLERCRGEHAGYMGYLVHFAALAALVVHLLMTIRTAVNRENFVYKARTGLLWAFGIFTTVILSNEVVLNAMLLKLDGFVIQNDYGMVQRIYDSIHVEVIKIALPVTWGIIAFTFLSRGIKRQLKSLRIMALVLLAITLIKLFTYDINNVSEAGKIIAFIILGIVLLVMSFMYQKIKALIMSEEKDPAGEINLSK